MRRASASHLNEVQKVRILYGKHGPTNRVDRSENATHSISGHQIMARKMNHLIATLMIGATLQGTPSQAATKGETMGVFTDLRDEKTAPMN